jgi:D-glycero-D-manno-heptose 1,7-bisphosphate phosphatase
LSRAVFLDRDGTILVERGQAAADPSEVELLPGAAEGLRTLRDAGYLLIVVTNQSGLARGLYDAAAYRAVTARMETLLAMESVALDRIEHCPHHPDRTGPCGCRKPEPGMLLRAAAALGVDRAASWCVGDAARDLRAGIAAGCRTVLVLTGKGEREREEAESLTSFVAADLAEAARIVLAEESP